MIWLFLASTVLLYHFCANFQAWHRRFHQVASLKRHFSILHIHSKCPSLISHEQNIISKKSYPFFPSSLIGKQSVLYLHVDDYFVFFKSVLSVCDAYTATYWELIAKLVTATPSWYLGSKKRSDTFSLEVTCFVYCCSKYNNMKKGHAHGAASPISDKIVFSKVVAYIFSSSCSSSTCVICHEQWF